MDKIADGHGTKYDLSEVENLDHVLQTSSHCGLGRTACNPVLHTLKHFRPAYENRLKSLDVRACFRSGWRTGACAADDRTRRCRRTSEGDRMSDSNLPTRWCMPSPSKPGQTVMQAALAAGHYIPHLCYHPEFKPHGSCKLCTVKVSGRTAASCTMPAEAGLKSKATSKNSMRCAAHWYRCCSPKATISAHRAKKAAIACCRRWAMTSKCIPQASVISIRIVRWMPRIPTSCSTSTVASCANCAYAHQARWMARMYLPCPDAALPSTSSSMQNPVCSMTPTSNSATRQCRSARSA